MKKLIGWVLPFIVALSIGVPVAASFVIPDGYITGAKLSAGIVDNSTIAISSNQLIVKDGGITQAKRAALNVQTSSSCGNFTSTSASYVDVTNLSVTITTTGRPVFVAIISDGTAAGTSTGSNSALEHLRFTRDGTEIADTQWNTGASTTMSSFFHIDATTAGSHTYKLQAKTPGAVQISVNFFKIIAFEL